jgi:hypothetical protein
LPAAEAACKTSGAESRLTGGVGEDDAARAAICGPLSWIDVDLDAARNHSAHNPYPSPPPVQRENAWERRGVHSPCDVVWLALPAGARHHPARTATYSASAKGNWSSRSATTSISSIDLKKLRNVSADAASHGWASNDVAGQAHVATCASDSRERAVARELVFARAEAPMKRMTAVIAGIGMAGILGSVIAFAGSPSPSPSSGDGKAIFRFDTFGDEQLWTDTLQMQKVLPTISPRTALSVGLKVDSDALPSDVIKAIKAGQVNLDDPAVTVELLKLNAVVGVMAKVTGPNNHVATVGITCALCHSTVDNSITTGIGRRLDGWPNRTLNVGAIVALSPAVVDKAPFQSWGPGRFDARLQFFDGKRIVPLSGTTVPVLIAPAYGLKDVGFETYTGDGVISYWNSYVGVTQMGGHGSFSDPRIEISVKQTPDLVTPKLPALLQYQLGLQAPPPPRGSFDREAARRGEDLFNHAAGCARCHKPPLFTDVVRGHDPKVPFLHSPFEVGTDPVYANRSATKAYRTTPLRALWQHAPYFHDGSAPDLLAVVNHYNSLFSLGLKDAQKRDLVEYLKTL